MSNGYAAKGCIKLGTSSKQGSATTPALSNLSGDATLTFRAAAWEGDATTLTVSITDGYFNEEQSTTSTTVTLKDAAFSEYTLSIYGGSATTTIKFTAAQASKARFFLDDVVVKATGATTLCSAPTFSPASGTTFIDGESLSVELSCATDGATIYYTTDGSDPSASSAQYTEALSISETTTVKAIAIDASGALENSDIVSATYTKLPVLDGIKGLRTQIESDNNSSAATYAVKLTDAVVTFVAATSKCYIEQDGVGIMFYKSGHGFSAGDTFNGTATVTAYMYNGNAEVTSIDLTPTSGTAPEPTVITVNNVQDDFFNYGLRYVKIENGTVGATAITSDNRNSTITDASSTTELTLRSSSTDLTADANATVNVTGVCEKYNSSAQFVFYSIEAVSTTKKFEFSAETATATVGDDFTEPTLTNEYGTTATYSSSNTNVATVDESTGDVTIVAAGETTITATDGTNSASYTLTVTKLTGDGSFENPYTVADMQLLYTNGTYSSITDNVWVKGYIVGIFADGSASKFSTGSDGETKSNMALADDANAGSYERTDLVAVQLSNKSNVRNVANIVENTDNVGKEVIVYGNINKIYIDGAGVKNTDKIYGLRSFDIKTSEGYATYYNDYAYEMPAGVKGSTVVYDESSKSLTMSWGYTEGKTVPNTSALLLYGTKGTYNIVVVNSNVSADTENNLYGSTTEVTPGAEDGYYFYKLAYENENLENLGWYWGAEDGAPFASAANLCYLKIPSTTSTATPMSFLIGGEATGISSVTTDGASTTQPIYSVSGVRMNGDANSLPKGLYIVGGKKVIIK